MTILHQLHRFRFNLQLFEASILRIPAFQSRFNSHLIMLKFLLLLFCWTHALSAQSSGLFLRLGGGLTTYTDDQDKMPLDNIKAYWDDNGKGGTFSIGYRFNPIFSLQLMGQYANFPQIKSTASTLHTAFKSDENRATPSLGFQINPIGDRVVSPYLRLGGHAQFLKDLTFAGFGGSGAIGIQFNFTQNFGLFVESAHHYSLPKPNDASTLSNSYKADIASMVGGGFHFNLSPKPVNPNAVSPKIGRIQVPRRAVAQDSIELSVEMRRGTAPMEFLWDLGNGQVLSGQTVKVAFDQATDYTIKVKVVNEFGVDTQTRHLIISPIPDSALPEPPPTEQPTTPPITDNVSCKDIKIQNTTLPNRAFSTDELLFEVRLVSNKPTRVVWTLPNQEVVEQNSFLRKLPIGNHQVKLYAANECSADVRTLNITVVEPKTCATNITLKPVYFAFQDPLITGNNYSSLDENVDKFIDCANICIELSGSSATSESGHTGLLPNRLDIVSDFYQYQSVNPKRIKINTTPQSCTDTRGEAYCRKVETRVISCQ